jgi:hypothetical protein
MSKPTVRLAFFVLVSLLVIAATSASVQNWLGSSNEAASIQSHVVSGLQTNLNHDRSTVSELQTLQLQMDSQSLQQQSGKGHGCESEQQSVPLD